MKNNELMHAVPVAMPRRTFLRNSMLAAVPLVMGGIAFPAAAAYDPPSRSRGSTTLSVRDFGARGDGEHDDTSAFQAAINRLPSSGGTVYVPAGTYMIDALKSIRLRKLMHLKMSSDAKLVAKSNSASRYYVILADKVSDVEISGGQIVGDRDRHYGSSGEWGQGIFIKGSRRVTIRDLRVSKCWGDGVTVGCALVYNSPSIYSDDVVIANIVSTENRRQGLSITRATNVRVYDSEFSHTHGTSPECGIDIEPDLPGDAKTVLIQNCVLKNNAKYGMLLYKSSKYVSVKDCTIEKNGSCGIVTRGTSSATITGNTIRYNSATGLYIQDGTNGCGVSGNTFYGNYARNGIQDRTDFTMSGISSKNQRDILKSGSTSGINIGTNYYR